MAQVTQDQLLAIPSDSGTEFSVVLTVHAEVALLVDVLTVAVRDALGAVLDFPGVYGVVIPPTGYTLRTDQQAFAPGRYTIFGAYQLDDQWFDLPSAELVVGAGGTGAPIGPAGPAIPVGTVSTAPTGPTARRTLAWAEDFNAPISARRWNSSTTSAYQYGTHNPADDKLDWLHPGNVTAAGGVVTFTARPGSELLENGRRAWDTGLLTTEGTAEGFQVQARDYLETVVQLPAGLGAWPALWTWRDGGQEIDTFEYHPDHPARLEFTNHVRLRQSAYTNTAVLAPLQWITIGTFYGTSSVDWYVNGTKVYSDHSGVPTSWRAFLILNLSVDAGRYHPAPTLSTPLTFRAGYLRVWR
ncbi:hypothetical protein P3T36_001120 [Kitasatospora sp. MAP12-15]|uniref:glycoside hydrolase family 16 protein n=1 Tax=unclassified Kitasatospora TaxID=2633591 RepID=UPI00247454AD|nr:hypothetical protein [Kitasatospora sp. MAP12-44]MDH6114769.1 hypothetical protein [Kitasatospora sp. MAP12-44]